MYLVITKDLEVYQTSQIGQEDLEGVKAGVCSIFKWQEGEFVELATDGNWNHVERFDPSEPVENPIE